MFDLDRLRVLAKAKRYSITGLAEAIGRNRTYFYDVKNKGLNVEPETYEQVAKLLGTTPEYLRGEIDEPQAVSKDKTQEYIDMFRLATTRPATKLLFSALKNATNEDIEQCVEILNAIKEANGR